MSSLLSAINDQWFVSSNITDLLQAQGDKQTGQTDSADRHFDTQTQPDTDIQTDRHTNRPTDRHTVTDSQDRQSHSQIGQIGMQSGQTVRNLDSHTATQD